MRRSVLTRPTSKSGDTRARIVSAALRVFANKGFEAARLNEITAASKTNVAAIHYHFGSKEALIQAVLEAVADPINRQRMEMLHALPQEAWTLEHVLNALLSPPIRLSLNATGDARLLTRLLLQARALPNETTSSTIFARYDETAQHFVQALRSVCPGLSEAQAYWRYAFAIGAMHYIVTESEAGPHRLKRLSGGLCNTNDPDAMVEEVVAFAAAGFRAA